MKNVTYKPIRSLTALPDKNQRLQLSTTAPALSPRWSIRLALSGNVMFIPVRSVGYNGLTVKRYRRKFAVFPPKAG